MKYYQKVGFLLSYLKHIKCSSFVSVMSNSTPHVEQIKQARYKQLVKLDDLNRVVIENLDSNCNSKTSYDLCRLIIKD